MSRSNKLGAGDEAALDEINLDTLLSSDTLLNEWGVEGYEDLIPFSNPSTSKLATKPITMKRKSSLRNQVSATSSRALNTNKADNRRPTKSSSVEIGTTVSQSVGSKNEGVKSVETSSETAKERRRLQPSDDEYFVTTESGDISPLFSTKDQRNEIMKSVLLTKDASRKIQSRMTLLAKESCGIRTSTKFHPYMALPDEVSMQKMGSYFPLLDLISSTTVAQDNQTITLERLDTLMNKCTKMRSVVDSDAAAEGLDANSYDPSDIVLLQIFRKYLGIRCDASNSSNVSVKAGSYAPSNMKSIALAVNELQYVNRNQLALELEDAWRLVQRQRVFFKQNMNNLANWCKTNFTSEMNELLFSTEKVYSNAQDELSSLPSNAGAHAYATAIGASLDSLISFYSPLFTENQYIYSRSVPSKLIFVNINFEDTQQESFPRLLAILETQEVKRWNRDKNKDQKISRLEPQTTQNNQNDDIITKVEESMHYCSTIKRDETKATLPKLPASTVQTAANYEYNPELSRESISSALTNNVIERQTELIGRDKKRKLDSDQTEMKIVSSYPQTTKELWDVLKKQHYFGNFPHTKMTEDLLIAWNPELPSREIYWNDIPTPLVRSSLNGTDANSDNNTQPTSTSLYHRLQSLLIEENIDGEESNKNEFIVGKTVEPSSLVETVTPSDDIVDVSDLTLDQRAYIHLRAAKLIDRSLWEEKPKAVLQYVEEANSVPSHGTRNPDVDDEIRKRQMDLSKQHRVNNETASHLLKEATIKSSASSLLDDSFILETYSQLMKKEREKKKAYTCRHTGDLPW